MKNIGNVQKTNQTFQMKWISIEEEPKESGQYFVAVTNGLNGFSTIVSYDSDSKQWLAPYKNYISHWMKKPELPNNKNK